jgi:hypothetical protein
MKLKSIFPVIFYLFTCAIITVNCIDDAVDDTQQLVALRKVTVTFDSMTIEFGLPPFDTSKTFAEHLAEDSATFANPANYSITSRLNMTADNTKEGAQDAKFDGMAIDIIMDTITSSPVSTIADPFTVSKNTTKAIEAHGTINLATHRLTGLYIFRQTVDGNVLATTISPFLNYTIGSQSGTIDLPDIKKDIPTRASPQTKAFLRGLLDSGIFNSF